MFGDIFDIVFGILFLYLIYKSVIGIIRRLTRMVTNDVLQTTERFHRREDEER